jgi:class 3 adenylate cyclase
MIEPSDTRYVTSPDGFHIAYRTFGEGERDIALMPYVTAVDVMWEDPHLAHVLSRLAGLGRLICLDFRGHGGSDPMPAGAVPTPEAWVEDLRVVLDEVGSEHVTLVAHGTAGFAGMVFAALYPERTDALVLVETWARTTVTDDYPVGVTEEVLNRFGEVVAGTWGTGASASYQAPSRRGDERFARWLGRYERAVGPPKPLLEMWWWSMGLDLRSVLPTIRVPTLVLQRAESSLVPPEQGPFLAEHIPGADFRRLPGRDNLFYTEYGDELVDEIAEFLTGARPLRDFDRALATVLFTDIVGSTDRAAELGDHRWARLLDEHDAMVERELERHRGVRVNHTGDGILATFDGPSRAIRCAQAIASGARPLGIEVRAGLHTGEIERRGDSISGIAVHIGQRVSALAGAGEVLVSSTVKDLVSGSGLRFDDRGTHGLKGVPDEWRIFSAQG